MLMAVLSPAKRLRLSELPAPLPHSLPDFLPQTAELARLGRKLDRQRVKRLMKLSNPLAEQCLDYFHRYRPPQDPADSRHAVLSFAGDTYIGLRAGDFSDEEHIFAQDHLRILSGFYGLLRPLDLIRPYRLEMGAKLHNRRGDDLYRFWGQRLARHLRREMAEQPDPVIVNLASVEYFKALPEKTLKLRVVTPVFREIRDGDARVMALHAKRARGMMARYIVTHGLKKPEQLKAFDEAGYRYRPALSTPDRLEFHRINEGPGQCNGWI